MPSKQPEEKNSIPMQYLYEKKIRDFKGHIGPKSICFIMIY